MHGHLCMDIYAWTFMRGHLCVVNESPMWSFTLPDISALRDGPDCVKNPPHWERTIIKELIYYILYVQFIFVCT